MSVETGEEPIPPEPPAKAIPPGRDRLQSNLIVWTGVPVLCYLAISTVHSWIGISGLFHADTGRYDDTLLRVTLVSTLFALTAWRLRAATPLAAACGGLSCVLITGFSEPPFGASSLFHSGLAPLILLFILTHEATRLGRERKAAIGLAEPRKGRNAAQVIANLGVAASFSTFGGQNAGAWVTGGIGTYAGDQVGSYTGLFLLTTLAALVEATADTVSSEIGQAFGGTPFLLTNLRRVAPGTDGAISVRGTLAGIAAGALIAATGAPAMGMSPAECSIAFVAGVTGLFFDSLLGATVERWGWIGNDLVNLLSTAFAATLSLLAIRLFWRNLLQLAASFGHHRLLGT